MWLLPTPGGPKSKAQTRCSMNRRDRSSARRLGSNCRLEGDVELVEGLVVGQPGELQPGGVAAALEHPDLCL